MRSYSLYLFDLDDTLIHTFETVSKLHYRELAQQLGVPYPGVDTIRKHWGGNLSDSVRAIFGEVIDVDQAQNILQDLHQRMPVPSVAGVFRILEVLRKHKKFVGLFSSAIPSLLDLGICSSLRRSPADFDFVFSTVEQGIKKPSPDIIFVLMEKYHQKFERELTQEQVVVIGDSLADLYTARNAGVDFVATLTGPESRQAFLDAGLNSNAIFENVQQALTPPEQHGVVAIIRDEEGRYLLIEEGRSGHPYKGHWSGPHGVCEPNDIIEEETLVREVAEECAIDVHPRCKLYTRQADTKINTVSFWETEPIHSQIPQVQTASREVSRVGWFAEDDILAGNIALYPGTKDFFNKHRNNGGNWE
jgi:phosphoglycolate phosphatase-like HAD superfamily hydrolase/8-oxo-dGTP pyrophosphatase MutT (NUDIX family)